jgi:hypothetical protein
MNNDKRHFLIAAIVVILFTIAAWAFIAWAVVQLIHILQKAVAA